MAKPKKLRAGNTEPFDLQLSAKGLDNLDALVSAKLFARKRTGKGDDGTIIYESSNHVDGVECPLKDSAQRLLTFDPVDAKTGGGNAFGTDDDGIYDLYIRCTWVDADETRHPDDPLLKLIITPNFE